jgi:hypothetical protein
MHPFLSLSLGCTKSFRHGYWHYTAFPDAYLALLFLNAYVESLQKRPPWYTATRASRRLSQSFSPRLLDLLSLRSFPLTYHAVVTLSITVDIVIISTISGRNLSCEN